MNNPNTAEFRSKDWSNRPVIIQSASSAPCLKLNNLYGIKTSKITKELLSDLNKQRIILELTKLELTLDIYLINQEVAWVNRNGF